MAAQSLNSTHRLGRAAGENTATGAFQRIEQAVANFQQRNGDITEAEIDEFRSAAEEALLTTTIERYKFCRPGMGN